MSESKHARSASSSPLSDSMGEIFAQNVDLWFTTQAELLADVDTLTHAWLNRRREGVDAIRQAIEQMAECQGPAEIFQVQQDWLAGVSRRATEDIAALNSGISSMTKKATAELETVARKVTTLNHEIASMTKHAAGDFESTAHKVTAFGKGVVSMAKKAAGDVESGVRNAASPIRSVGEETHKTAGGRPHKDKAVD